MSESKQDLEQDSSPQPVVSTRKVRTPGRPLMHTSRPHPAEPQPEQDGHSRPTVALPSGDDIDPKRLTTPVLTRHGWICPDDGGNLPRGPR